MSKQDIRDIDVIEEGKDEGVTEGESLYAEELPDQTDLAAAAGTNSSISTGSTFSCPSSVATAACVSSASAA